MVRAVSCKWLEGPRSSRLRSIGEPELPELRRLSVGSLPSRCEQLEKQGSPQQIAGIKIR
jgi:hypothetical protein